MRILLLPSSEGAQLETAVPNSANVGQFVSCWVPAASDAQGLTAKLQADREVLESQDALKTMLGAASDGISAARKQLTSLGQDPTTEGVAGILQNVTWSV